MASAPEPDLNELQEIGRRLCKLLPVEPEEPMCAEVLRRAYHDPICNGKPHMVHALTLCADALAALELPAEVREAREAIDEYVSWSRSGCELRLRLLESLMNAKPFLDDEAERRAEARAGALTDDEREQGFVSEIWPSPESLTKFPIEMIEVLGRDVYASTWLQKIMHDLPRLDASFRVATLLSPIKTGLAKALARAGCEVPTIATVTEPFALPGAERRQARNTVKKRIESSNEDLILVPRVDPSAAGAEALTAQLKHAANFVAGVGADVRCVGVRPPKRQDGK